MRPGDEEGLPRRARLSELPAVSGTHGDDLVVGGGGRLKGARIADLRYRDITDDDGLWTTTDEDLAGGTWADDPLALLIALHALVASPDELLLDLRS